MSTEAQYKILIIEDDAPIRTMYELKLKNSGFLVQSAHDGDVGLVNAKTFMPDLILLDLKLPTINGDVMLEKLRQTDWGANMRVVILTNISKDEAPQSLRVLGVDRYIVKAHHTPAQIVDIVRDILAIKH